MSESVCGLPQQAEYVFLVDVTCVLDCNLCGVNYPTSHWCMPRYTSVLQYNRLGW